MPVGFLTQELRDGFGSYSILLAAKSWNAIST